MALWLSTSEGMEIKNKFSLQVTNFFKKADIAANAMQGVSIPCSIVANAMQVRFILYDSSFERKLLTVSGC